MWSRRADDFTGGEHATVEAPLADDYWSYPQVGLERLVVHPAHLLDAEAWGVLEVFNAWYSAGGMGGRGPLPFAGGYAEQPAGLMRALHDMAGAATVLDRRPATPAAETGN